MGFYLRKSFKAGPLRINLSKGGLGVSAGVTGARIGVNSRGQAYTHAGRYGVYHRQTLGGGRSRKRSGSARTPTEAIAIDTGATFASDAPKTSDSTAFEIERPSLHHRSGGIALMGIGLVLLLFGSQSPTVSTISLLSLATGAMVFFWGKALDFIGKRFGQALERMVMTRGVSELPKLLQHHVASSRAHDKHRLYHGKCAYLSLLRRIVADGVVDSDELNALRAYEQFFSLSQAFVERARLEVFRQVYLEAVSDHELSEKEEEGLHQIRKGLSIPADTVEEEFEIIDKLARVRQIRSGEMEPIQPSVKLQKNEVCYHECPGRILKWKILNSYRADGVRYKESGFVVDKEGDLLITSKRLLLVHEGTTSIRHNKILDVDVDADQALISVTKDGAKKPLQITTPDAIEVGATLAAAAQV